MLNNLNVRLGSLTPVAIDVVLEVYYTLKSNSFGKI